MDEGCSVQYKYADILSTKNKIKQSVIWIRDRAYAFIHNVPRKKTLPLLSLTVEGISDKFLKPQIRVNNTLKIKGGPSCETGKQE
jgi:hypothetical protein